MDALQETGVRFVEYNAMLVTKISAFRRVYLRNGYTCSLKCHLPGSVGTPRFPCVPAITQVRPVQHTFTLSEGHGVVVFPPGLYPCACLALYLPVGSVYVDG